MKSSRTKESTLSIEPAVGNTGPAASHAGGGSVSSVGSSWQPWPRGVVSNKGLLIRRTYQPGGTDGIGRERTGWTDIVVKAAASLLAALTMAHEKVPSDSSPLCRARLPVTRPCRLSHQRGRRGMRGRGRMGGNSSDGTNPRVCEFPLRARSSPQRGAVCCAV